LLDRYDEAVLGSVYPGRYRVLSKQAVLIACVSLLLVPKAVFAHHSLQAQFDTMRTITVTGTVTKMDWSNPHVRIYVELKDRSMPVLWELYMGSPNLQMMNGMKIDTFRRGDHVRVEAYPARDGSPIGYATKIRALSGR
jgi:hypothetical protein